MEHIKVCPAKSVDMMDGTLVVFVGVIQNSCNFVFLYFCTFILLDFFACTLFASEGQLAFVTGVCNMVQLHIWTYNDWA